MSDFELGVLDFSVALRKRSPQKVLQETITNALLLESLGYTYLWFGEHHHPNISHAAPEVLAAAIAARTSRIRLGAAGMLLKVRSPMRVAGAFRLLAAMFPGRIDLGLARGGVAPEYLKGLIGKDRLECSYEDLVDELLRYLEDQHDILVSPVNTTPPRIWMLGSGTESAKIAAKYGTAYCLAICFAKDQEQSLLALDTYRKEYVSNTRAPAPISAIAIAGACASTMHKAKDAINMDGPVGIGPVIWGTPDRFYKYFSNVSAQTGVNTFIYLDTCRHASDRLQSYKLLSKIISV